jgi:hypothetical protein
MSLGNRIQIPPQAMLELREGKGGGDKEEGGE